MKDSETKGCCEKCKAKPARKGIIGTPWCGKWGKCECHATPPETSSWSEDLEKIWSRAHIPDFALDAKTVIQGLISRVASSEYKRGAKKIADYVRDCHANGFEMQTVVEHLENEYIFEDILEDIE